ncbi:MAG: insulinase family protein [Clostridia bacterium]|nr:insulinase family protein [Clostridia bacterium]
MVHLKSFDNGIRLVVRPMEGLMSVTMGILVGTGACVETDEEDGISHFIEHMMFKGTDKRNAFQISDEMDRIGAQVNAFTGKDLTCYYAKSITENAPKAFEILADLFLNSKFPEHEMVREKGVVVEEINMTEDTPDDLCLDLFGEAYYGKCGYGRNILGTPENVNGFTRKDIKNYMAKRYTTDNIVIAMAGNIDISLAEDLVEKYFGSLAATHKEKRLIPAKGIHNSLVRNKDIEQVHIAIGYPSVCRGADLYEATQLMNSVLGGSMSSRLFQTVREKLGLAYTVYSYLSPYAETGTLTVYAGVNAKSYKKSVNAVYKCIEELKKKYLTEEEFLRGKEQMKSSFVFAKESSSSQMLLYGKELIYNDKLFDFDEKMNKINAVTREDVIKAIDENFDEKGMAAAIVGKLDEPLPL